MARKRKSAAARRRAARWKAIGLGALVAAVLMFAFWNAVWVYLVIALAVAAVGTGGWALWRRDRTARREDHRCRAQDAVA